MIRHVVLLRFAEGYDTEVRARWQDGLDALLGAVPGLRALTHGADVLGLDRSWSYAVVADFDSIDDVGVYATHPAHLPLLPLSASISEQVVSVDFELPVGEPT